MSTHNTSIDEQVLTEDGASTNYTNAEESETNILLTDHVINSGNMGISYGSNAVGEGYRILVISAFFVAITAWYVVR